MRIQVDVTLPFDRDAVFATYRDRAVDLVPYLPNIRSIELKLREQRGDDLYVESLWLGGGDIPKVVRGVLNESMLRWTDVATWHADFTVSWRTEVHAFPGAVNSAGLNRFVALADGGTRLELRGELTIDASRISAVPRFLEKSVAASAEKIIVGSVETNARSIATGVVKLLTDAAAGPARV